MFLNPNVLKKLMKAAYKEGMIVARDEDRIYLAGSYWEAEIKKDFIPKETMGDIISLVGELPEDGKRFRASKEGNQYEVGMPIYIHADPEETELEISDLLLVGCGGVIQRLLQDMNTGKVYAVSNVYVHIVDNNWCDEARGEYTVERPFKAGFGIIWQNNVCKFHAYFREDKINETTMKNLQGIDISTRFQIGDESNE
ncbi:MAG: hypothetical protein KBT03_12060 [Bacteroidales bacterium]|nr:hypothetical protein [Candidatus Scybalousia scybalohippi]